MDNQDRRALKDRAMQRLAGAAYSPKKLILIHTGIILILSALLTVADYLLEQQIGSTGGLGGIGLRSALETAQSVLRIAQTVLLPFWQIGYIFVTMRLAREESLTPWDLCEGFRRFGPVLRLNVIKTVLLLAIGTASSYVASTIFFLTPFSAPLMNALAPLMSDPAVMNDPAALQEAITAATDDAMIPLLVIFLIVFLGISIPVLYRYRMASYFLLDNEDGKAIAAMRSSRKLLRYLCFDLFKLDLNFWWFYLLDALVSILCYGDLILGWMGVSLPIHADVAYFLFLGLYLLGQLALYLWRKNEVEVTYACAYDFLRDRHDPRPKPQKHPWAD